MSSFLCNILLQQKHEYMLSSTAPVLTALCNFTSAICPCNSVLQNAKVCTLTYNSLLTLNLGMQSHLKRGLINEGFKSRKWKYRKNKSSWLPKQITFQLGIRSVM